MNTKFEMNDQNIKRVLFIIPAYNEEKNIGTTISNIRKYYSTVPICVINDCSNDNTRKVLLDLHDPEITILNHPIRQGYGVAIQTGYKYALRHGYDFVLQMDADGQHDPIFIPKFLNKIEKSNVDVVIGSRFLRNKNSNIVPISKKLAIYVFRFLIKLITGSLITDPTSGYQVLNKKILRYYTSDSFPIDFPDANVISWALRKKFTFSEIPVDMSHRSSGKSMHKGIHKNFYYMYKVLFVTLLSIFVRKKGD